MKRYLISLLFLWTALLAFSQDRHFSQFYASPLTLNPALTGAFEGRHRITANYRTQWQSILPDPFRTMGVALDMNFRPFKVQTYKDKVGVGVSFFSDKVGPSDFTTNQIGLLGSYHKALNVSGTHYLSAGFSLGILQKSIVYSSLTFNDQFNGSTGYTLPTDEQLPKNNFAVGDLSAGLQWSLSPSERTVVYAGAAFHHINQPQISFYSEDDEIQGDNPLFMQFAGHIGGQFPLNRNMEIQPRALIYWQGPHIELNAGANLRFSLSDYNDTKLYLGGWARPVRQNDDSFDLDAVVVLAGFQLESFVIGLSYDLTTSSLSETNNGRGAFEVSLSYIGSYENESVICPVF